MKSWQSWFRVPRVRRGLALGAVVLSCGGLVLYKAPAQARSAFSMTAAAGKNASSFSGPGVHGSIALSQAKVLAGQRQPVYAEIKLTADATTPAKERAPIAMAVVLDTSGSMSGEKITEARRAVLALLRDMRDDDEIAFVRYSSSSELVQPLARVGDVRASLESRIQELRADGGTNIASGLSTGRAALGRADSGRIKRIVLVSDGLDGSRASSEALARSSFDSGITVSSLGVGLDFDESYMGSVATNGHGNFAFVKDGADMTAFLRKELVETSSTTIEHAKVRVRIPAGARFVRASGADVGILVTTTLPRELPHPWRSQREPPDPEEHRNTVTELHRPLYAVVLAAGEGSRMKSERPKPLHRLCGKPMLAYVLESLATCHADRAAIVVGHKGEWVTKKIAEENVGVPLEFVEQDVQRGTGDAALIGLSGLPDDLDEDADVIVLPGDTPLLTAATIGQLVDQHRSSDVAATVLTAILDDATGYGRVVRGRNGRVTGIVEHGDATDEEQAGIAASIGAIRGHMLHVHSVEFDPDAFDAAVERGRTGRFGW
mgnify:CR=1 FL=1